MEKPLLSKIVIGGQHGGKAEGSGSKSQDSGSGGAEAIEASPRALQAEGVSHLSKDLNDGDPYGDEEWEALLNSEYHGGDDGSDDLPSP